MSKLRALLLNLSGIGLLGAGTIHFVRQRAPETPARDDRKETTQVMRGKSSNHAPSAGFNRAVVLTTASGGTTRETVAMSPAHRTWQAVAETRAPLAPIHTVNSVPRKAAFLATAESESAPAALPSNAVQLSENVRLPAALMPTGRINPSPTVEAAASQIANIFYQSLRDGPAGSRDGQGGSGEDNTTIIENGPRTEEVLRRADELFRALYGEEKCNQQSLSSAIEVSLSPSATQPSE